MRRQKKIRKNFQVISSSSSSSSRLPTSYGIFLSAEEEEGGGRRRVLAIPSSNISNVKVTKCRGMVKKLKGFVCRFYQ